MLGSANRDASHFSGADEFAIDHQFKGTVSFGKGAHSCFGKALVKQQMEAGLNVLFEAFPNMRLVNEPYLWEKRIGHRWLINCPVLI